MASTTTINQLTGELIHNQNGGVTVHHLGCLTQLKADGNLYAYAISGDNSNDLILYTNSVKEAQGVDFLLDGDHGNGIASSSSHESMTNLLDEGLGTSLDGMEDLGSTSFTHSTLGRNDSGVFSGDETPRNNNNNNLSTTITSSQNEPSLDVISSAAVTSQGNSSSLNTSEESVLMITEQSTNSEGPPKKQWAKNSSANRQGPQRCAICGKTFSNASALTKHKLTHSDERKYACSICGKAFKRQDHLNGHMLTHRNKKPFECSVKGCGKSYCDARSLRRHVESRHGHETGSTSIQPDSGEIHKDKNIDQQRVKSKKKIKTDNSGNGGVNNNKLLEPINSTQPETSSKAVSTSSSQIPPPTIPNTNPVKTISSPSNPERNKYVMVKVKDKLLMATPTSNTDNMESLFLRNTTTNTSSSNIVITPETIASILSTAIVQETTKLTNDLLKVSIPVSSSNPTSSQLHQLLTRRPSTPNNGSNTNQIITTQSNLIVCPPTSTNNTLSTDKLNLSNTIASISTNWKSNTGTQIVRKLSGSGTPSSGLSPDLISSSSSTKKSPTLLVGIMSPSGVVSEFSTPPSQDLVSPTTNTSMSKSIVIGNSVGASGSSSTNSTSSPALLKEQLELIQQIIQQAQEDCINNAAANASNKSNKSTKGKKGKSHSVGGTSFLSPPAKSKTDNFEESSSKFSTNGEEKPVECTICCRRFKNTPALNGHMRLHGGYFKGGKDPDEKRKDSGNSITTVGNSGLKDTSVNAPLQTASVSIRALIEEKIIQKRTQGIESSKTPSGSTGLPRLVPPTLVIGRTNCTGKASPSQSYCPLSSSSELPISPLVPSSSSSSSSSSFPIISSTNVTTPETNSGLDEEPDETFQFIYSQEDDDNADYLLKDLEEEVFNKVSSICPESFLDGIIDESILNGGNGNEDLVSSEWNWGGTNGDGGGTSSGDSRLQTLFTGTTSITEESPSHHQFSRMNENEGTPYTPLPPLDANIFYMSPAPKSPSIKSQDSPSFIYPTPPASLESQPTLQSPFHSFASSNSNSSSSLVITPGSLAGTGTGNIYTYDTAMSNISTNPNTTSLNLMEVDQLEIMTAPDCKIFPTSKTTVDEIMLSLGEAIKQDVNSLISITHPNFSTVPSPSVGPTENVIKLETTTGTVRSSEGIQILTPSSSPVRLVSSVGSPILLLSQEDSAGKELKLNEASQMETTTTGLTPRERLDVFLNPNSVPGGNSAPVKSPKRKQVRNTFASNLRPHPTTSSPSTHFTPYPILSPVRSAPGLYWTFSNKLSHVDDSRRQRPRINVGLKFQVTELPIPILGKERRKRKASSPLDFGDDVENGMKVKREFADSKRNSKKVGESLLEDVLWDPQVMENCSSDEVDKYLEFACCSAVPGGGRNKEYALHLLSHCNGDINTAIILLMNPQPQIPLKLQTYHYPDGAKWIHSEINAFQEALLKYGKDFQNVAQQIGNTKSREDCVSFYHYWKKVCGAEYDKVRSVWKKRDATFTLDLLKTVPPNLHHKWFQSSYQNKECHLEDNIPRSGETVIANNIQIDLMNGLSFQSHEDYPCKICGKIFTKVKSRSAHMKSHRPPEQNSGDSNKSAPAIPTQKKTKVGLPVMITGISSITSNNNLGASKHFRTVLQPPLKSKLDFSKKMKLFSV